jgi:hypothetical protein
LCHARHDSPAASAVTPAEGPQAGGTAVTISGAHLSSADTTVTFGANAATSVQVVDDGSLIAVAPPGAGTVAVTIANGYGTSPPLTYTYLPDPTPTPTPAATATATAGPVDSATPIPLPTPTAVPTENATAIRTPTPAAGLSAPRQERLLLTVTGAMRYRLRVNVAASAVRLTRDARGQIVRISAGVHVHGPSGKTAALTYSLTRTKGRWSGAITISDPGARLHQRFRLNGTPKLSNTGRITGYARATVHHRRATLRFALYPA